MIAPFSDTAQVIRIAEYNIHPTHQVDPRQDDHALHNVAIARLACRYLYVYIAQKSKTTLCVMNIIMMVIILKMRVDGSNKSKIVTTKYAKHVIALYTQNNITIHVRVNFKNNLNRNNQMQIIL